ncbi:MAG: hypothetical protein ACM3SV_00035 [Betaproteobacteria bacterium]
MKVFASLFRCALLRFFYGAALKMFLPALHPGLKPAYIRSHVRSRRPEIFEGESRRIDEPNRW